MGLFKPKLRADIAEKKNRPGVRVFVAVPCVAGLPTPERALSQIYYFDDRVEVVSNDVEYNLPMDRIQSVSIQRSGDIQTQYVSSAGGALIGAAVAGPVGAAIGGRMKKKTETTITSYLVFQYINKSGEVTYMSFDASHTPKCQDMERLFQSSRKSGGASIQIEL